MSIDITLLPSFSRRALVDRLLECFRRHADTLRHALDAWQQRAEQRRLLMRMDERMLKDIAVSRADAEHEAAKPFWRP